jgi:actin-like ATPase involved in cell morphogenesis
MNDSKVEKKMKPGCSCDVGTSNIVVTRQAEDGTFVSKFHRNMLYPLEINEESMDLLDRSSYAYIKTDEKFYIIGDDGLSLVNALGKGTIIRPMQNGLLTPSSQSSELLFQIIKAVVGDPIVPNEPLRYTVPASSNSDNDNLFHQKVLDSFFTKLGFAAKPVNEAMAVMFDCNAKMKLNGEEVPMSGIAVSCGAGMWNICMSFKGMSLIEFSCTKSGDFLDQQVEKVTGVSSNRVMRIKEKLLNLDKVDETDRVQTALSIYYDEMISRMIHEISNKFKDKSSALEGEIEIVVAGGTSMPPGFCKRFELAVKKNNMPFKIYAVRHADHPFTSVSEGACIRARSDYERLQKK